MTIINRSNASTYVLVAHRELAPGQRSAESDMGNLRKALTSVLKSCGHRCIVRLNDEEHQLIDRILALDAEGQTYRRSPATAKPSMLQTIVEQESREKAAKIASLEALRSKEEAIKSETTYASRKDIDNARQKANKLNGIVDAKSSTADFKDVKDVTGTVSLNDLMSSNRFIEESMKHSNIPTALASDEGWDKETMIGATATATATANTISTTSSEASEEPEGQDVPPAASDKPAEPAESELNESTDTSAASKKGKTEKAEKRRRNRK